MLDVFDEMPVMSQYYAPFIMCLTATTHIMDNEYSPVVTAVESVRTPRLLPPPQDVSPDSKNAPIL